MKKNNKQSGQGLTEYAVILSMVAVAAIAAMGFFGGAIKGKVASLSAAVSGDTKSVNSAEKDIGKAVEGAKKSAKSKGNTKIDDKDTY